MEEGEDRVVLVEAEKGTHGYPVLGESPYVCVDAGVYVVRSVLEEGNRLLT